MQRNVTCFPLVSTEMLLSIQKWEIGLQDLREKVRRPTNVDKLKGKGNGNLGGHRSTNIL